MAFYFRNPSFVYTFVKFSSKSVPKGLIF